MLDTVLPLNLFGQCSPVNVTCVLEDSSSSRGFACCFLSQSLALLVWPSVAMAAPIFCTNVDGNAVGRAPEGLDSVNIPPISLDVSYELSRQPLVKY